MTEDVKRQTTAEKLHEMAAKTIGITASLRYHQIDMLLAENSAAMKLQKEASVMSFVLSATIDGLEELSGLNNTHEAEE
jgi:ketopantoate hydroxymethyltransferase